MKLLLVKLDLFLNEWPGRVELFLEIFILAWDSVYRAILECAILCAESALGDQIAIKVIFNVAGTVCMVTQSEGDIELMAFCSGTAERVCVRSLHLEPVIGAVFKGRFREAHS